MSLIEDILTSNRAQTIINKNTILKNTYNIIQNKKETNLSNLTPEEKSDENYRFSEIVKNETKAMDDDEKIKIVKHIFKLDDNFPKTESTNFLKYNELEFFESNSSDKSNCFFNKLDKTKTILGKIQLTKYITNPITDINILNQRKHIIESFTTNTNTDTNSKLDDILQILDNLKKSEGDVLWFFKENSDEINNMLSMVYFNNFWNSWVNNNENLLNVFYYIKLIIIPLYGLLIPIFVFILPFLILKFAMKVNIPFKSYWNLIKKMYFSGGGITKIFKQCYNIYDKMGNNKNDDTSQNGGDGGGFISLTNIISKLVKMMISSKVTSLLYYMFTVGSYLYSIYSTLNYSYSYLKIIKFFQTKLNKVSLWVRNSQLLFDKLGYINSIELKETFSDKIGFTTDKKIHLLNHLVFQNDPNYILSNKGVILKQFKLLKDDPSIIKSYLEYISIIDVWSSVASLQREHKEHISLPTYLNHNDTNNKPEIIVEDFYNMMIDNNKSVKNSILIKDDIKNIMITGPNASGKSTFLKAITECLILGQTICIVPATNMKFTPFHHINTYLNIPDCQGKESLFQAEMSRCYNQIESFKEIKNTEFVFSIMDEIFVSTNYFEGLSGAYAISKKMSSYDNSICFISTHFSTLSEFTQKEKTYKNYHFSIEYDKDDKIEKSYLLKEGRTTQHIALEMLEEKGFDPILVNDAKKMYKFLTKPKPTPKLKPKSTPKLKPKLNIKPSVVTSSI
jgi:DNA mismatch repair ATPase MutS